MHDAFEDKGLSCRASDHVGLSFGKDWHGVLSKRFPLLGGFQSSL